MAHEQETLGQSSQNELREVQSSIPLCRLLDVRVVPSALCRRHPRLLTTRNHELAFIQSNACCGDVLVTPELGGAEVVDVTRVDLSSLSTAKQVKQFDNRFHMTYRRYN